MVTRPIISSLWIGGRLTYIEQLCLKSFVDRGHRVKLYSYDEVVNLPEGVEAADANPVLPNQEIFVTKARNSPAATADKFRYHLLAQTDEIWVDTDAYCVRPFPDVPYIFATERDGVYANGVLRLPKNSPALHGLIEFCSSDFVRLPSDFVYPKKNEAWRDLAMRSQTEDVHICDAPWGVWGPRALTYYLDKYDEAKHVFPSSLLYPVKGIDASKLIVAKGSRNATMPLNCYSVHLFGSVLRTRLRSRPMYKNNEPIAGSFLAERLKDHGIDPKLAPLL